MALTKIIITNFQGIEGIKEYTLNKITALCQKNGTGKTSLLNALRYGITGAKTDGEIVRRGKDYCSVELQFNSGKTYKRIEYAEKGKSSESFLNDRKISQKDINAEISLEFGYTPNKTAKIISSQELLQGLSTQQFGELLLQYLPEQMTVESILQMYPEASEEEVKIIKANLPEGEFSNDELNDFYKLVNDRRKYAKKVVTEQEATINTLKDLEDPKISKEELEEKREELMKLRDKGLIYNNELKAYNEAVQIKEKYSKDIEKIDEAINKNQAKPRTEEEINTLKKNIEQNNSSVKNIENSINNLTNYVDMVQKFIDLIKDPEKSKTTREEIIKNLLQNIEETQANIANLKELNEKAIKDNIALKEQINSMAQENFEYQKKEALIKQKEEIEKKIPQVPTKPTPIPELSEFDKRATEFNNLWQHFLNYKQLTNIKNHLSENRAKLLDYENLSASFSPKGKVKEAITSYYLEDFANQCNEKADKIKKGMKLKFVSNNGIDVLVDINGNGKFMDIKSLSAGERAIAIYLIIDMLSGLSGFNTIILDELSILDNETFEALLDIIIEHQDEFNLCLISAVDHADTLKALEDKNIDLLKIS